MIIHSPIISGSLTFADGAALSLPNPTEVSGSFSGSAQFTNIGSDLIPDASGAYDLGSEAFPFQDLWLIGNTISIGGIGIGAGVGGINIKNKSDNSPAEIGAKSITIGGSIGSSGSKKFKLNSNNKVTLLDENDDEDVLEVKELILKDTSGAGKNTKLTNDGGKFTTAEINDGGTTTSTDAEGSLSGSFTGSIRDAEFDGDATFNNGMSVTGTVDASGLASLDGGIDVSNAFSVATSTGNVSTSGTLGAGNTTISGTVGATGLASLDGGVDVDGAFTVANTSGNVSTSGTLGVTGTSTLGVINASGLLSADAGIDVDGVFTVADGTGNVSTTGTLGAGNTTITGTVDASGLASLDGGVDVDGAFTVADTSGNVSTSGTLGVTGTSTLGVVNASGLISADAGLDVDGAFTVADGTGNVVTSGTLSVTGLTTVGVISGSAMDITGDLGVGGDLTVAGAMTTDGHIIPALHNTYDLGSTTKFWRDLYLSSGSLYINGIQVLSTDGTDLTFQTDEGESTKILETANDTITLETVNGDITLTATGTGNIELDAPIQINAGKNILSSDGNAINFGDDISLGVNSIYAANLVGVVSSSAITYDGNNIDVAGNTTIQGNLTVQGTQTQLNTATLNIEDKNLLIASGAADSAAANGGGITIDGADATITWVSADSNIAFNTAVNIPTSGLKINSTAVTSTATELNVLDGIPATLTATELGYVDGVTSAIQTQIDELHTSSSASNVSGSASYIPLYDSNGTAFQNSIVSQSAYGEGDLQIEINGRAVIDSQVISTTYSSPSGIALRLGGSGNSEEIRIEGADIESATDAAKKLLVVGTDGQIHTADGNEDVTFDDIDATGLVTVTGTGTSQFSSHLQAHCLGIGMTPSFTAGEIHASADIVAYSSSDKRLKENIKPIENPLGKIAQISGNTFDWIENDEVHSHKGSDIGVIAQEIEAVLPELVTTRENGYKAVKYDKVVALLIEAVKDQQAQIDELKSKLG